MIPWHCCEDDFVLESAANTTTDTFLWRIMEPVVGDGDSSLGLDLDVNGPSVVLDQAPARTLDQDLLDQSELCHHAKN